jgi:hypothetical protein
LAINIHLSDEAKNRARLQEASPRGCTAQGPENALQSGRGLSRGLEEGRQSPPIRASNKVRQGGHRRIPGLTPP